MSANINLASLGTGAPRIPLDAETLCNRLAERFRVRLHEIALLRIEGAFLRFVFPAELRWGGDIPLNSSAMAARSARERRPQMSNAFNVEPHWRLFERIHTRCAGGETPKPIQKIMSVPAIDCADNLTGVIQISRKADTYEAAGPNFQVAELALLQRIAMEIANLLPLLPSPETAPVGLRISGPGQRQ